MTAFAISSAVFFVFANGFFVAVEFAAVGARRTEVDARAESGRAADRAAQRLQQSLLLTLGSSQLGITVSSLALGKIGEPAVGHLLEDLFHDLGIGESLSNTLGFAIALAIVVFIHTVIGEMVPKNMTIVDAGAALRWLALPMAGFVYVARPVVISLIAVANGALRLLRLESVSELDGSVTAAELGSMVRASAAEGLIGVEDSSLLAGALAFGETNVDAVMVPIADVDAVPASATVAETEAKLVETEHTRLVVYEAAIDEVLGFVHGKDLLAMSGAARERPLPFSVVRPMVQVRASASLPEVVLAMRRRQTHLGVVLTDQGNGVLGVVTMDGVLAALVSEPPPGDAENIAAR